MFLKLLLLAAVVHVCYAPPVSKNKAPEEHETQTEGLEDYIEYHRYIREVVNALESDPKFREKLEKANEEDIRTGKIAHELELVSHHVRSRLDEIKRTELNRLRTLVKKQHELLDDNTIDDPTHHHVDHANPHTFEIADLKKLIAKTTEDLADADKKRRDEFKQYEMQKEFEKRDKLNHTSGEERDKLEKEFLEMDDKHKKHEKLHTPGHKQQLEEVWEEQDHMQQDFNPKTFFMLHDLDSNGLWDQDEVKALFVKELDKMYAEGAPEDDMRERVEEMERMRESVFNEMDANRDGFIDFQEFLHQTKKNDYEKDNGWQGIDEQRPYTDEELDEYMKHQGMNYPPYHPNDINAQMHPQGGYYPPGGYQPPPPGYHQPPHGAPMHPQAGQMYPPGQMPPPHGNQKYPPGQVHPQGGQMHPQGVQMHPQGGQMHPQGGQMHPQGGQMHPHGGQMNPQGGEIQSQQGQFQPGQLPQAQINPQHIPNQAHSQENQGPTLNTNEVYPNQNQHQQQQQNYPNHQQAQQQQPLGQQHHPNQQQPNKQQTNPQSNEAAHQAAPAVPDQSVPQVQKV